MFPSKSLVLFSFLAAVVAQQVGTNTPEVHPALSSQTCTASGCTTLNTEVVIDSNWRWLHSVNGYTNCYTGNTWDKTLCPDPTTCAANCALDGADYAKTYGITTSGNALTLKFVTGANIGSRVYLASPGGATYNMFMLKNKEFTFDVDVSNLPCGLNGALYFSQMDADGGLSRFPTNKAGAKYGTGYCDAQCPHDLKFINGEANILGWTPASNDINSGAGQYGTCCSEMDIWEANSQAAAFTPHPCTVTQQTRCSGTTCGDGDNRYGGVCDKDGCDFNSYRQGNTSFYGQGKIVDTNKVFTVVTQFITAGNTDTGALTEIRRFYVQNGKVIPNSVSVTPAAGNSITDSYCTAAKTAFGDTNSFATDGGLAGMGNALAKGMVLALSIWDDHAANALWLDSTYPVDKTGPGAARGPCATTTGVPADVEAKSPGASVTFSNIKVGTIGSTFAAGSTTPVSTPTTTATGSTPTSGGATAPQWGQCGGIGWTGPTVCAAPYTCKASGAYYSQCL